MIVTLSDKKDRKSMLISKFFDALRNKKIDRIASLIKNDAVLTWGPFTFKGKSEILKWAKEFTEHFEGPILKESYIKIDGDKAFHRVILQIIMRDGGTGQIACLGRYKFVGNKFEQIKITLSWGLYIRR